MFSHHVIFAEKEMYTKSKIVEVSPIVISFDILGVFWRLFVSGEAAVLWNAHVPVRSRTGRNGPSKLSSQMTIKFSFVNDFKQTLPLVKGKFFYV